MIQKTQSVQEPTSSMWSGTLPPTPTPCFTCWPPLSSSSLAPSHPPAGRPLNVQGMKTPALGLCLDSSLYMFAGPTPSPPSSGLKPHLLNEVYSITLHKPQPTHSVPHFQSPFPFVRNTYHLPHGYIYALLSVYHLSPASTSSAQSELCFISMLTWNTVSMQSFLMD